MSRNDCPPNNWPPNNWPPNNWPPYDRSGSILCRVVHTALLLGLAVAGSFVEPGQAAAGDGRRHALSLAGEPKQGPDFQQFEWVNPEAPKGGSVRIRGIGTFDTLNRYAATGMPPLGIDDIYARLLTPSLDEPLTEYGLVAAWVSHPADYSSVTFGLRPEARFHDGAPITAADVVFTLDAIKKASPRYALYYQNVVKAEQIGPHEVTFTFDAKGNRELPQIVGSMPVLPKHFWTAKNELNQQRDLARGSLELPLGSGPYRVKSVDPGRTIVYERVKDWWAKDLPVNRGQWNFDELTFAYYRDRTPAFEGFKTGETDFWPENSAKGWATGYEIEPVKKGLLKRHEIESREMAPMQGFAFNTRRKLFADPRVRQAFNLAFNFEQTNKNMFFEQYVRVGSYFDNSELAARGLPKGRELEILETVRGQVPPEVFAKEWHNPVNKAPEDFRRHLSMAAKLLDDAGWTVQSGVRTNAAGDKLAVEFLLVQPDFERLVLVYKVELEKLGLKVDVRTVDSAQYHRRVDSFDFDIVVGRFAQSLSPGNEQREFWGSAAADKVGTLNLIGIKNPAVDSLIETLIFARDRAELVSATHALDRVLLWNHYLVPQFYSPRDRIAYWDKFGHPERLPGRASVLASFLQVWWQDQDRAARLAIARR